VGEGVAEGGNNEEVAGNSMWRLLVAMCMAILTGVTSTGNGNASHR